jgi:hypothetical protein
VGYFKGLKNIKPGSAGTKQAAAFIAPTMRLFAFLNVFFLDVAFSPGSSIPLFYWGDANNDVLCIVSHQPADIIIDLLFPASPFCSPGQKEGEESHLLTIVCPEVTDLLLPSKRSMSYIVHKEGRSHLL